MELWVSLLRLHQIENYQHCNKISQLSYNLQKYNIMQNQRHQYFLWVVFCFALFFNFIRTEYIASVLTPTSYIINQATTYTWVIYRNNNPITSQFISPVQAVPSTAYLQLKFPTSYSSISSSTTLICYNAATGTPLTCTLNLVTNVVTVTGLFQISGTTTAEVLTLTINGIKNPARAQPCGNFEYYIKRTDGTIIDQSPSATSGVYSTSITFLPSTFRSCSISANNNYISTRSRLTFTITTANPIPSDGQLIIDVPLTWQGDLDQSSTIASTPSCAPVSGLAVPTCTYTLQQPPISIARVTVSALTVSGLAASTQFVLDVSSILTPPYTNYVGQIAISSQWADGIKIDSCSARVLNTIPIPFRSVTFAVQNGTTEVQTKFTGKLSLTLSKSFSSTDEISLLLPNNFLTNNQISLSSSNYAIFTTTVESSTSSSTSTKIILSNFPASPSILPANNVFTLFFTDVYNYQSIQPQSIVITFFRSSQSYQSSTVAYASTIGTFRSFGIVSDNSAVNQVGNGVLTIGSQYRVGTGGIVLLQYNSDINAQDVASSPVASASINGAGVSNVSYQISTNIITIRNLFKSQFPTGTLQIKLPKLTNPPTTKPTAYTLTILSSTSYAIATSVYIYTASVQPFKSNTTLTSSSYKVIDPNVVYTLSFQTYYSFRAVSVIVPVDVTIGTGFQSTCSPNTFSSCVLVTTGVVKNVTFFGLSPAGLQTISWGNNINPNSFKPTSSFQLYTYSGGWGVQRSTGSITLSMNQQNTLLSAQSIPSSYVNNALMTLQINYILPGFAPTGTLIFTLPSVLQLTYSTCSGTNIGTCTIIPPTVRIAFTNTNNARDTSITYSSSVVLSNIRNAPSFKPIDNIAAVLTSSDNFQSLSSSFSAWTNIQLSSFNTVVSSDVGYRGQNAIFSFTITGLSGKQTYINIRINSNFKALDSFTTPIGGTLISGYQVQYNVLGEGTVQKSFTLQTPTNIGDYTFTLRTYTSDNFLMGQSTSNVWRHSCYGTECRACTGTSCINCYNSSLSQFYIYNTADSTCIRGCNSGFYLQLSTNNCIPCSSSCQECINSSSTCTKCYIVTTASTTTIYYLNTILHTCVTQCPTTYYPNDPIQQCSACVQPCYTCQNDNLCTSCITGYYLLASSKLCLQNCPANVMVKNEVNRTCDACDSNCLTCSVFIYNCTSCNNTAELYLEGNVCVAACSSQKFLKDNICTQCEPPCRICHNSTTTCSSCFPSSSLPLWYDFKCISTSECAIAHFVNSVNGSCDACPVQCQQCLSLTNCSACSAGFYLYANTCITTCPNITYPQNSTLKCQACVGCVTCSSVSVCTSCRAVQFLYQSVCYSVCPSGTFSSSQVVTTGTRAICVVCPVGCPTCINNTYCLTCLAQQYLYKGVCYTICPTSTFPSSPRCIDCPITCSTCTSSSICLTCAPTYSLQNSQCVLNCQLGVSFNQICYPCGLNCALCAGTTCQRCVLGYYLYNNVCMSQCPSNTLSLNGMTCVACTQKYVNCTTCNTTHCLSCQEGELTNGQCLPCVPGYYTMNSKCVTCPLACSICTSPTYCTSCSPNYYMEADFCVSVCPNNKIPNGTKCDICTSDCSKCNIDVIGLCSICVAGMYMFEGHCLSTCPEPYVVNLNTTLCITKQAYSLQYSKASKPIYFPFSIAIVVCIILSIILKMNSPDMHVITFIVSIGAWIELASWILFGVIQYLFYTNLQTNAGIGIILVLAAIGVMIFIDLLFLRCYCKYFVGDFQFQRWEKQHQCINKVFLIFGAIFTFKAHRILYSKVLNRDQLSLLLSSPKKLIPISVLSVISILLSSGAIIVGTALALYNSLNQDQQFFNALDTLTVTGIMCILVLLDLRHSHSYFIDEHEAKNIKNKMYHEDYEQFSINNKGEKIRSKKGNKYQIDQFQQGSNISRENLVEAAGDQGMDNLATAKKFRPNKNIPKGEQGQMNETMRETGQSGNKLKQVLGNTEQINSQNDLLAPPQNEYNEQAQIDDDDIIEDTQPKWIQKQYDHHGYLIKRDPSNNIIRYDENGYRIEIDENGGHHKYDENGYEMKYDKQSGKFLKYDKEGFRVADDGQRYDARGYKLKREIGENGENVDKFYDQHGYNIVKDVETGEQIKLDQYGNKVVIDPVTGLHKPLNKDGHEIIYGKDGKENLYKNEEGRYVRLNPTTKTWEQYDPQDGFLLKKNEQTGEYQKFDQHGFKVKKDQFGNIYRYDDDGNRVIIGANGNIKRFDKQGYELRKNALTGEQKRYDKEGYQVRVDAQTGTKTFYDNNGYRVQRDFYGNVTLYDQQGNMIIIDPVTRKHRKFNKEGLEIMQDEKGERYLKDKRGRKVVELQDGYYEKYDEQGNKIWLDEQGYEVQTDKDGNITRYDKIGDPVQEDDEAEANIKNQNGEWELDEGTGDNAVPTKESKQKKPRLKFKQAKEYNFEQQYSKMVQDGQPHVLNFEDEQEFENNDNLKEFHDVEPVAEYELEKQYQTLYNMETENEWMRRQKSQGNLNIKLEQLQDIDNTPYQNLKQKTRRAKNKSGQLKNNSQVSQNNDEDRIIQPEDFQDKIEMKSVADASISQRSFENQGVQPIKQKLRKRNEDDTESIQQIDAGAKNRNMMKKDKRRKNRRSEANLENRTDNEKNNDNRSQNNYMNNKEDQKQQVRKIYDSDDQVQSLEQEQWQNQPTTDIFYKQNPNTNTHTFSQDKGGDLQEQSDILSDYLPQNQESDRQHKASQQNILHKKYMQSIEQVEDELFEKLKSQDNRKVKRTDFKLSGTPNPLVEYAKTIDVKRIQEERGKGRKDRYADTNRNNAGRR